MARNEAIVSDLELLVDGNVIVTLPSGERTVLRGPYTALQACCQHIIRIAGVSVEFVSERNLVAKQAGQKLVNTMAARIACLEAAMAQQAVVESIDAEMAQQAVVESIDAE